MEPSSTVDTHARHDPGDFVAEEVKLKAAHPNYIGIFLFLGFLTAIELAVVQFFHASVGRVPILLTLTVAKGLLVALYYMHLKFDSKIYSGFFAAGIFAFAVPFTIVLIALLAPPTLAPPEAGQGGTTEAPVARPTRNPNAGPPIAFTTSGTEFAFNPAALSANAGQAVNLTLTNVGSVEHNFTLAKKPKSQDDQPWQTNDGQLIAHATPGQSSKGAFIAPGPGEWLFYCSVPGHAPAGMFGTLTVK